MTISKNIKPTYKIWILVFLILSLFPFWVALRTPTLTLSDDSLITLTFAKNIAQGRGFVYNHPPAVLGTTTPLFAIVLGVFGAVSGWHDFPRMAVLFSALCWGGLIWLFYIFRTELLLKKWQSAVVALLISCGGWVDFMGMEAYLFSFLLLLSVGLFLKKRFFWSGFCIGLLFLTRGEGVILFFILAATGILQSFRTSSIRDGGRLLMQLSFGFSLPFLSWSIYALHTFGNIFPNTLIAKIAQGESGIWKRFSERLLHEWLPGWNWRFGLTTHPLFSVFPLLFIAGVLAIIQKMRIWLIFLVWILFYILGYSLLGVAGYSWYSLPIRFVILLISSLGIIYWGEKLIACFKQSNLIKAVFVLVLLFIVYMWGYPLIQTVLSQTPDAKSLQYHKIALWLSGNTKPEDAVAHFEIGYLGYFTSNRIIDLVGLIDKEIPQHVAGIDFQWGFWRAAPQYLIYYQDSLFQKKIINDLRFAHLYHETKKFSWKGGTFILYQKNQKSEQSVSQP
jgi:hypothetical protein